MPDYECWYSRLKGDYLLTVEQREQCKRLFEEKGKKTFAEWLAYYNNLDVAPGLEALEKMRGFYAEKEIDILKDAVSIPGVSFQYLLRGAVERGACCSLGAKKRSLRAVERSCCWRSKSCFHALT